jgi:hypothetical protein
LGLFLVGLVAAAGLGWWAGASVKSPAEEAARTAAPEPSPILAPVEVRNLSTDVVTRGTGRFGSPRELVVPQSPLKERERVITEVAAVGQLLNEGATVALLNARPVFLLVGQEPMYRDLGVGMSGQDVAQLEAALDRLGANVGTVDGVFDDATARGVTAWYRSLGHEPLVYAEETLTDLLPIDTAALAAAWPSAGVIVPVDEVQFIDSAPVLVAEVLQPRGHVLEGPLVTVTDSVVTIDSSVPVEEAALLQPGMVVAIDEPDLGVNTTGVIGRVAPNPGTDGVDGFHVLFDVVVDGAPSSLVNASVRLTIAVESTGTSVLAVPTAAVTLAATGRSQVEIEGIDGFVAVEVLPGLSAQGFVELRDPPPELVEGVLVLIGFETR